MIAIYRRGYDATTDYEIALGDRDTCGIWGSGTISGPGWIPRTEMRAGGWGPTWSGGR